MKRIVKSASGFGAGLTLFLFAFSAIGMASFAAANAQAVTTPSAVPTPTAGYLQFNDLTVTSMSEITTPATVYAAPPSQSVAGAFVNECTSFVSRNDTLGSPVPCPLPPGGSAGSYVINITNTTQLLQNDRTPTILGNIAPGDIMNVYGYFSGNGIIQAQILRDLSKPEAPGMITPGLLNTGLPTAPVVGENPSEAQLLDILQTLVIQMQGVLAQLVQISGAPVPK